MFKQRLQRLKELNTADNADITTAMTYFLEKVANAALYGQHQKMLEIPHCCWSLIMPLIQQENQLHALGSALFYMSNCQHFVYGFAEFADELAVILYFFEDLQLGAAVVSSATQVKLFRLQKANDK